MKIHLALFGVLLAGRLMAALAVGDVVPVFTAKDQHDKAYVFTNGPTFLIVATEMAASKVANQKLAELGAGYLEKNQAVYVLDIHTMPGVARLFALPKMRKYPQRMILVDSAETLAVYPTQADRVTVLTLTPDRKIKALHFWDPVHEPLADVLK